MAKRGKYCYELLMIEDSGRFQPWPGCQHGQLICFFRCGVCFMT